MCAILQLVAAPTADNYYHGTSGAFLDMAPADAAWELLSWFKAINNIPHIAWAQ